MQAKDLHEKLEEKYGKIKSLKVSLNKDYVSREYGFVTFEDPNIAQKAVEQGLTELGNEVQVERYCPKDKKDLKKTVNSIFVKNFPNTWNKEYLTKYFSKYGDIQSVFVKMDKTIKLPYGFICFGRNDSDIQYGYDCVKKAVENEHDKEFT